MDFVRIGRRIVNLDYVVVTEGRSPGACGCTWRRVAWSTWTSRRPPT